MLMRIGMLVAAVSVWVLLGGSGVAVGQPSSTPFEVIPGSFHFTTSTGEAAAHGDWVTSFDFAHDKKGRTFNDVRNIVVSLPPGFTGNNTAVPTCTQEQLAIGSVEGGNHCPP